MKVKYFSCCVLAFAFLFIGTNLSYAAGTGAFNVFGVNAEAAGKGYAFTGEADNPSAVYFNPAGISQLNDGKLHVSAGITAIQPMVEYTSLSGNEVQMRRETFYVPSLFAAGNLGLSDDHGILDRLYFGVGVTSNWGLSTEWADDSFSRYQATKTELENIDSMFTIAYQLTDQFTIAGGAIWDVSKITKDKEIRQATPGGEGQLKGDDQAWGYTVSGMYAPNERHQFGLHYRSEIELNYEGHIFATGLDTSFGYSTLFGGSTYTTRARSKLTLPQSLALGYSFRPSKKWRFNADIQWTDWSSVENEKVHFPNETNAMRVNTLEALTGNTKDWESVFSLGFGAEYHLNEALAFRGGYFYNESPIPDKTFDTTVPENDVHGLNLGVGYAFTESSSVDMAWTVMLYEDREVDNTVGNALGSVLDGKYENVTNVALFTYNHIFP